MKQGSEGGAAMDIAAAQRRLIESFLAAGDSSNEKFRRICYAAAVNALDRYMDQRRAKLTRTDMAELRNTAQSTLMAIEKLHDAGGNGEVHQYISMLFDRTNNSDLAKAPCQGRVSELEEAPPATDSRPAVSNSSGRRSGWRAQAIGFLVGCTLVLLCLQFLQAAGLIYVHHQPEGFQQLKRLNEAMAEVAPSISKAKEVLHAAESRLTTSLSNGELTQKSNPDLWSKFLDIKSVFPDFFKLNENNIPRGALLILRIGENNGFKILMYSELCPAVSFSSPEMVDPVRTYDGFFCSYFGVWNKDGRNL